MRLPGTLLAAAVLLLAACEHRVTEYPVQPKLIAAPSVKHVYVVVNWIELIDEIQDECKTHGATWYGCSKPLQTGPDIGNCTLWVLMPKDFNDVVRLAILGHDFFECLGARHAPHAGGA